MYRKMLMMSVYKFSAANTYSSGLRDSCLFPSSSWVSTARNCGWQHGHVERHPPRPAARPHRPPLPLTQVKSRAPSEAYTISRMRFRTKMQRTAKTTSTTMLTRSTPMHEVKS